MNASHHQKINVRKYVTSRSVLLLRTERKGLVFLSKQDFLKEPGKAHAKKRDSSIYFSYDGSFSNVFCVCVLLFYDVFFFYHKA